MVLLQALNIKKQYGLRTVLDFQSFAVYEGDKIGIVGANGAGKSTLLGILSGEVAPDEGAVTRHCTPSYIRQFAKNDTTRSGGENAKARFREEVDGPAAVVFADEPTANLDADGQKWVLQRLGAAPTLLLISHDRELLDHICTRIVEIKDGALTFYTGNYSDYEAALEIKKQQNQLAVEEYKRKKGQLEDAVQKKRQKAAKMKNAPSRMGNSEARLHKNTTSGKKKVVEQQAKVLKSRLDRLEKVENEKEPPKLRMDFSLTDPPGGKHVLSCEGLSFAYGEHVIFDEAHFAVKTGSRTALTGKNGSGKTTLLRLIVDGDDSIRQVPKLKIGYLAQDFSHIDDTLTILENTLKTSVQDMASVRSALAGLLFRGDDVHKKVAVLSGGEKMRLSIAMLIVSSCNALVLDEPTNYLDLRSLRAVAEVLCQYPGTILFVSHDKRFVQQVATEQLIIRENKLWPKERLEQKEQVDKTAKIDPARKMLLELRKTQLVGEISSAPAQKKTALEAEYAEVMSQLKSL